MRNAVAERELTMMRWGLPPPRKFGGPLVTNIRNTSSPHWRGWLKSESRCLVPANSFSEYAPEPNPLTKKKDVVWFALNDDRPLVPQLGNAHTVPIDCAMRQAGDHVSHVVMGARLNQYIERQR